MNTAPKPARRWLPWKGSTIVVFAFLALTILPAFIAFALTPPDAQIVTNVQGWNGCAYTVRHGDNLFRIGARYGVTYHYLAQSNGIYNANYIWAGQVISVPCGPVPYPAYYPSYRPAQKVYPPYKCPWCQPFEKPNNCGATGQYQVQAGDNLFRIAVDNGSTIQWIRTENQLWGKVLRPGMLVNVPCLGFVKYGANVWTRTPGGGGIITATPQQPTVPTSNNIGMRNGNFNPRTRTVRVGTIVTWENREPQDGDIYTVTSGSGGQPNGLFASGQIPPGGRFSFEFTTAGSYSYFSESNPTGMTGEILVVQ